MQETAARNRVTKNSVFITTCKPVIVKGRYAAAVSVAGAGAFPMLNHLADIVRCPLCQSRINQSAASIRCTNESCSHANGYPIIAGQPVLITFDRSIFDLQDITALSGEPARGSRLGAALSRLTYGRNISAHRITSEMIDRLKASKAAPRVLVLGGGTIGSGTDPLYSDHTVEVVGTDVYASPRTVLVCDGHDLPFADNSFDGVVIQAVLEHVLSPERVVQEIYRVLTPRGIVFADTPFMQQVHMGAYDFTRFTQSGHRWLFRHFDEIHAGATQGTGMALIWSIRYFGRSLGIGDRILSLIMAFFFWLRLLDRFAKRGLASDGASAFYFLGVKSTASLSPKSMVDYYKAKR